MIRNSHTIGVKDTSKLDEAARELLDASHGLRIWLFEGPMGAGKTTLIKHLCKALGVTSTVQSPTFSIVNEYDHDVFHFDLYRLKNETEVLETGFEEYLESGSYCFIEWPEKAVNLWPETYALVDIRATDTGERRITLTCHHTATIS